MARQLLYIFSIFVLFTSCKNEPPTFHDLAHKGGRFDGRLYYQNELYTGKTIDYWDDEENKQIKQISNYYKGIIQGERINYYSDGQIEKKEVFDWKGYIESKRAYTPNGILERKEKYQHVIEGSKVTVIIDIDWFDWCGEVKRRKRIKNVYLDGDFVQSLTVHDQNFRGC